MDDAQQTAELNIPFMGRWHYSRAELIADGIVHAVGIVLAIAAGSAMLALADIYAVISYYIRHRDEVRTYLKGREEEAGTLRAKIEAERPRVSRDELLARACVREKADASTGQ